MKFVATLKDMYHQLGLARGVTEIMRPDQSIATIRVWYGQAFPDKKKEAANCHDQDAMAEQIAYWFQMKAKKAVGESLSLKTRRRMEKVLEQPLPQGEGVMAKKKGKAKGTKRSGPTVRSVVLGILERGKPVTVDQVAKEVKKVKPSSAFNSHHLSWYRNDFIAKGLLSKTAIEATKSVGGKKAAKAAKKGKTKKASEEDY